MHVSCNPQATVTTWDMKKETFGPQIRNICLRLQERVHITATSTFIIYGFSTVRRRGKMTFKLLSYLGTTAS